VEVSWNANGVKNPLVSIASSFCEIVIGGFDPV